jgi:hypothetical protein
MSRVQWIDLRPRDPATAGLATLRFAGGAVQRSYFREENGQHYKAGVVSAPRFAARIGFGRDGFTGQTVPQASRIQIAPAESEVFESLAGYFWKDAEISIDSGPDDAATFPRLFTGTVVGDSIADGVLTLTIADLSTRLDKPVCDQRFAGNGGIEGGEEAEGRTKRRSWGFVFNVEGRLLDPANSIYEFGDPAFPLSSFSALRDKGRTGPFTVLAWQGSIAATFAALQASTAAQGGGVVAPSIACAKWWTQPSGPLTADFIGTPGTGGSMAVASLIDAVSARFGGPAVTNRSAANALRPAAAGWHVGDETTTGAQVIDRLALGSSLIWIAAPEGVIRLLPWTFDNGGAAVLQGQFIGRERAYAPHYRKRVGFQANNRRHSESEIAESIRLDDGVLFESLRPAEPNATAGAVIPDPQTYVPGDPYPGYIRDSAGNVRDPGELLNSELAFSQGGRLGYDSQEGRVEITQLTPRLLGAVETASLKQVEADLDTLQRAVTLALSETSKAQATFRDVGVYTDPVSGIVRIHAIEQTRERVNLAEITLNAQQAAINLRATTTYVNEQIALAVIDPSQIADLEDIIFRIGAAEVTIDGLNATVTTLATVTELSGVEGRVTNAEEAIDALEGTITTKVDSTTFDLLATRVTNAETTLTSIGDVASITNAVSATRLVQRQLDSNTDADIRALLLGDRAKREEVAAIAAARNELGARITEQGEAQASFSLSLQARVGAAESSIATESLTRSGQFGSLAQSITNLAASLNTEVGTLQGNIDTLQQALVDETGALATSISEVSASLDTVADNLADETQNRIDAVAGEAGARIAAIEAEAAARGEALTAEEQARIAALQAERDQTIADIAAEAATRNEAVGIVDARVTSVEQASVERDGAINASITRQATAARGSQNALDDLIDRVITGLILSDRSTQQVSEQVAFAREEITAELTSAVSGFAASVFALGVRIGATEGSIRELDRVVIENNTALVQSIDTLTLSTTASIGSLTTDLSVTTGRVDTVEGDVSNTIGRVDGLEEDLPAGLAAEAAARTVEISGAITAERVLWQEGDSIIAGIVDTISTTVDDNTATLVQYGESIDGLRASAGIRIDINGRVTGIGVNADAATTKFTGVIDQFELVDPDTGAVYLGADEDGLRLQNGKVVMDNGVNMLVMGAGFGVDNQFVMWFGPSRAINLCNEDDALFFLDVTGDGEYGLRLGSNFYKNSGTGTSTANNAEVTVGPFVTEGGVKQVSVGYQYRRTVQITDAFAYTGTPQAVVRVERRVGTGSFETVGDYTFNGQASGEDGFGPSEPGFAQIVISQNASFTDNTGGTGDFTYRASIISRSVGGLTSTVSLEDTLTQRLPLIITEQIT